MQIRTLFLLMSVAYVSAQAVFYPTPRPKDLVERYFKEDPDAVSDKKRNLTICIDDAKGRIDYAWKEKGKLVHRSEFMKNRVHGSIECQVIGESLPLQFSYRFTFESPCKERYLSWMIASLSVNSKRFITPNGKMIRMKEQGFDIAVFPEAVKNPSKFKNYPCFLSGDASRSNRDPLDDFKFALTYQSYCLPRVVPCGMSGSREEIDSPFFEGDLLGWGDFLWKNKIQWHFESRLTLGPGLDAAKATSAEMIDELIYNVQTAKSDNWIPWTEGGEPLMASLNEVKAMIESPHKKELPRKLDEATQRLEILKGKGRSEFYPMVRTYLVFLKKKTAV